MSYVNEYEYRLTRLRGNWALTYNDATTGKRHRHSLKTRSRREAEKIAPRVFEELTRPEGDIIDNLISAYIKDKTGRVFTQDLPRRWFKLRPFFGGHHANSIAISDCRHYQAERLKAGLKTGTVRAELSALRIVLNWAKNTV